MYFVVEKTMDREYWHEFTKKNQAREFYDKLPAARLFRDYQGELLHIEQKGIDGEKAYE